MAGFTLSELIPCPPREVFACVTSPGNAPRISPSVVSMVQTTDGPLGVGTRYRETRLMRGREESAELEVVAWEPDQTYAVKNLTEGIATVYRYTFRPEGTGTRVDLACEVTASGAKKLMIPVVVAVLRKEDGDHLRRLTTLLTGQEQE